MYFTRISTGILAILVSCAVASPSSPSFSTVTTYDNTYDNPNGSLNSVACSNGANGLVTKGFTTFDSLPSFPYIGGAQAVAGWNSPNCGTCWALTYKGKTIHVLAVDHAGTGFNIAQKAMDKLTGGHAVEFGKVSITAKEVDARRCGM